MFPPTKVENIEENSRERVDWTRMFNTNSCTTSNFNPPTLHLAAWSILHQEEVKPPEERTTSSCYCRGGANCYPNVIGPREVGANFKHARIVPPVVSDFRLLSLQGLAWRGSLKFCHLPFASTALQFTIRLWIVRRIGRDKCWTIGELVLSLKVSSRKWALGNRHIVLTFISYISTRISPMEKNLAHFYVEWGCLRLVGEGSFYMYKTQAIFHRSCSFNIEIKGRTFFRFHRF